MSFAPETERLVEQLFKAEYKNACENWGEKYHSLHEGYAVLLEELEEAQAFFSDFTDILPELWKCIKKEKVEHLERHIDDWAVMNVQFLIKELAQVGAVLLKIKNTLEEVHLIGKTWEVVE